MILVRFRFISSLKKKIYYFKNELLQELMYVNTFENLHIDHEQNLDF